MIELQKQRSCSRSIPKMERKRRNSNPRKIGQKIRQIGENVPDA